jgi:hypothetical protein
MSAPAQKPRPREHNGAHAIVCGSCVHGLTHFALHDGGPGVELVGSVQGDGRDAVLDLVKNVLVTHGKAFQ